MRKLLVLVALLTGLALLTVTADRSLREAEEAERVDVSERYPDVRGVWEARRYHLAAGEVHAVHGRIVFGERNWQVLFFVVDGEGTVRRGSGEGGDYRMRADTVVFLHRFHLSAGDSLPGLPASPLRMEVTPEGEGSPEPTRVRVAGDTLTLHFPSGNRMVFSRLEAPTGG